VKYFFGYLNMGGYLKVVIASYWDVSKGVEIYARRFQG